MAIDFEWTRERESTHFTISITQINPCTFLSTWLNATLHILCFVLSCLTWGVCWLCVCRESGWDDVLLTDDPSLCCRLPLIPQTAHMGSHETYTSSLLIDYSHSCACDNWMCTHRENIWLLSKIRTAQTSETQTNDTHQPNCVLFLIPFGIGYLTSNIVPLLSMHKLCHFV